MLSNSADFGRNAGSREKLVDDVCQAICSVPQRSNTVTGSNSLEGAIETEDPHELRMDVDAAKQYLDGFIQKLNHFLYLSSEAELRQVFQQVLDGNSPQQDKVIELCLILALGANCTGSVGAHVWWYVEARSRLYHFGKWVDDLWMMRILAFLCLYHLNISLQSSYHLLGTRPHDVSSQRLSFATLIISDLALQMGLASGLDAKEFPASEIAEPERSHWLRVWESLRFLHIVRSP
jgi:hypothetical protein